METIVISVGGSAIVPDKVDYKFLKNLKKAVLGLKGKKIVICTGGGSTARKYMAPLKKEGLNEYTQDLVGIEATRINAHLVASFIGKAIGIDDNGALLVMTDDGEQITITAGDVLHLRNEEI